MRAVVAWIHPKPHGCVSLLSGQIPEPRVVWKYVHGVPYSLRRFPNGFLRGAQIPCSVRWMRESQRKARHCLKPGFYEPSGASYAPSSEHVCGIGEHLQYTGLLCGLCGEAHYRSGPHRCSPCSSSSVQVNAPPFSKLKETMLGTFLHIQMRALPPSPSPCTVVKHLAA